MRQYIEKRVLAIAEYLLKNGGTVRSCAGHFGISKTTVHKDMRERLPELNASRAAAVQQGAAASARRRGHPQQICAVA